MSSLGEAVVALIASQGVEVVSRGPNVKRGEVNIKCPFCGANDPSHHLGINPQSGYWACWRNAEHRGKSPVRLLVALLGQPAWQIRKMLGLRIAPDLGTFKDLPARLTRMPGYVEQDDEPRVDHVDLDALKLREFNPDSGACRPFIDYLWARGLLHYVARDYDLRYCIRGDFKDRVVFPYMYRGEIVTVTGRSIHSGALIRYRDLEPELSVLDTSQTLYNYDHAAQGGRMLVIVEGPFDALKGDFAGSLLGVHVVGLSTNSITDEQVAMLIDIADAFDEVRVCMDTPTRFGLIDSHKMVARLRGAVKTSVLDASALGKDFGGASVRDLVALFTQELDHA